MENEKSQKRKLQATCILTLFAVLADIYLIMYIPKDYILAAAALVTFLFSFLSFHSWFKWKDMERQYKDEQYSNIMKAEKGNYVISTKKLQELDDKINFIGQKIMPLEKAGDVNQRKIASMLEDIVEDQKKIAKITISRNKENAEALMNSNDKLMSWMENFRESMENMKEQLISSQGEMRNQEAQELGKSKDELLVKIEQLRESIAKEVDEIASHTEKNNAMPVQPPARGAAPKQAAAELSSEPVKEESTKQEESVPEEVHSKAVSVESEETKEEIPAVESEETQKEITVADIVESEGTQKEVPAAAVESEGTQKKDQTVPVSADPNKVMSPEDIAALISNTEAEDLSDDAKRIDMEEKPPMPDMSDPNKPMSPEDIAALIANM